MNIQIVKSIRVQNSKQKNLLVELYLLLLTFYRKDIQCRLIYVLDISQPEKDSLFFPLINLYTLLHIDKAKNISAENFILSEKRSEISYLAFTSFT